MENLVRILKKLRDPAWVNRPMEQEREYINQAFPETVAPAPEGAGATGAPQAPNPNSPIKPGAIDNMLTSMNADKSGEPQQSAASSNPMSNKLKYLDTMNQVRKNKFPELQDKPALGGGFNGLRL